MAGGSPPLPTQTPPPLPRGRPRLGELLVRAGCISAGELDEAVREQRAWGGRLGQNLVARGLIDEETLALAVARQLGLRVVDLERTPPDPAAASLVPLWLAERHGVVGLRVARDEGRILVACTDPTSNEAMGEVRRATGLVPSPCVATASQIDRTIRRHYYGDEPWPSPDPQLQVSRGALKPPRGDDDRLGELQRRIDQLLEAMERSPRRDPDRAAGSAVEGRAGGRQE